MNEAFALKLLELLVVGFPPLAALLGRLLPADDAEPLVAKVRAILPVEGASTGVRRMLEEDNFNSLDEEDEL